MIQNFAILESRDALDRLIGSLREISLDLASNGQAEASERQLRACRLICERLIAGLTKAVALATNNATSGTPGSSANED
jgi:hypothetical protein